MGLTFKYLQEATSWRTCPNCKNSLVDAQISNLIMPFCERGAFHSKLLGIRNTETNQIEYWKCPECESSFSSN